MRSNVSGRVDPDFVPVSHPALRASDAIIVDIAQQIHGRNGDAGGVEHAKALILGELGLDEWRLQRHLEVGLPEPLSPLAFLDGVARRRGYRLDG
jgi:hypothetical protein